MDRQLELTITLVIVLTIVLLYTNSCNSSYFGSGPTIFNPDLMSYPNGIFNNDFTIEPVYKKILPKTLSV